MLVIDYFYSKLYLQLLFSYIGTALWW